MNYDNRSVSVGSLRVGYRVEGHGGRKMLLLHGLNSHSGTWRKCFAALAREATVVAPSLPANLGDPTSDLADEYADLVYSVCEDSGIKGATVVGNSMGGWVAMRLLSRHGEAVSRIVLEDTAGSTSEDVTVVERAQLPVLIVWGDSDRLLPVAMGRSLHSRLSRSELRIISGGGHVPHWETPEEFTGAVAGFVHRDSVSTRPP